MMKAASSAEPCFTGRVSAAPADLPVSPPKAAEDYEMKLRFIPLHMM